MVKLQVKVFIYLIITKDETRINNDVIETKLKS